jgi:exopolysaccharide production protein ExoZ
MRAAGLTISRIMPDPVSKPGAAPKHLLGVQYLRAVAALMVAYFHAIEQIPQYAPYLQKYLLGHLNLAAGVDVFFVISGFIMLITNRNGTPGKFALRRIIRIVPLYWFLTVLLVLLALWQPSQFRTTVVSAGAIAKSLLFIPYLNPGHPGEVFPLLVPGWTLNLEMFFYAVFALALFAPGRFRVAAVGLILGTLVLVGVTAPGRGIPAELLFYTDARLLEFWLGMLIAQLLLKDALRLPRGVCIALIVCGFAMLLTGFPVDLLGVGNFTRNVASNVLPAAAIILGAVCLERAGAVRNHPWLLWLGDASYSIYLTHIFSLGVARFAWHAMGLERDGFTYAAGFAVFGMVLVVAGAGLVYSAVEVPVLKALQKLIERRRRVPAAAIPKIAPETPR